jgi:hypothetical protein
MEMAMRKSGWQSGLDTHERAALARLDRQIAIQTSAVQSTAGNTELRETLTLLKYERYLLQSKAAARVKRKRTLAA